VQAKWKPLLGAADIYKRIKAAVITPFLVAEAAKQRAAQEAAQKAAEEAAKTGQPIVEPSTRAAPKAGSGGRRSVALRSVKVVTITDRAAVTGLLCRQSADHRGPAKDG
jgi:ribosomal protein S11